MIRSVKISSRPSNMAAQSIHLERSLREAKLETGPMTDPRPGPTLAIAVPAALKLVMKSLPAAASATVTTETVKA